MKKKIIDTGKHLPEPTMGDYFELQHNRKTIVEKPVLNQSRRDKTILYGRYAVNKLLGKGIQRDTYDFDVYTRTPLKHAQEIERSIDTNTNSNLAYVERTNYIMDGKEKPLVRVKIRPFGTSEADYNRMPKNVKIVVKNGVRYENLNVAKGKYTKMIHKGERGHRPFLDRNDINIFNMLKRRRR